MDRFDWDNETLMSDDVANELTLKTLNERMKAWSKDLSGTDPIDNEEASIEFGTIIGSDPWKMTDNDPISLNFVNPWGVTDISSSQNQVVSNEDWANFDTNNFADFDTHFTDFEPIGGALGNMVNNLTEVNSMNEFNLTHENHHQQQQLQQLTNEIDELKLNRLTITKNLIPGADGRLVLATNVIPFENKSDKNANIHTDTYSETELDNLRFDYFYLKF